MELGGRALWRLPVRERVKILRDTVPAELIVPMAEDDYGAFFDAHKHRPDAEGIVLKRLDSHYIGSLRGKSADNRAWTRCKWRLGEDGLTPVA